MISRSFIFTGVALAFFCGILVTDHAQGASVPKLNPLEQIIEGAKKEGNARVLLVSAFTQKSMDRLRKEIREKFGVDLDIKFSPTNRMPQKISEAIMEYKVGAPPTYDLMTLSNVIESMDAGIFERVDWKPLLIDGTNPEVVMPLPETRGAIVLYTAHTGLMYNTKKITPEKVPKTLKELADPQWKGKVGIFNYTNSWARTAFLLGKEKTLSTLRGIMKNSAVIGSYADIYNRYLLDELSLCFINSGYMKMAQDKGMPVAWQGIEVSNISNSSLNVRKGAKYPNAAKLVALYLASPQGAKFTLEEALAGNIYYPGNYENDISMQDKKQGIRAVVSERDPELIKFFSSEECDQWEKEIKLILESKGNL